ncbi:MAG: Tryptophan synthase beta chain [Labilithrix sp.]|nr:Tryptophan synthase beta chain [Labilithrix sp.]
MVTPIAETGWYGPFGGRFVSETLIPALDELTAATNDIAATDAFNTELRNLLATYVGRPTPLTEAVRLAREIDPTKKTILRLFLKREDLCHTGAHKINNALGQVLLASKMGKTRIIAETGAGQHGVATATACALFGLPCEVYMGAEDVKRQAPNVGRMKLLPELVARFQSVIGEEARAQILERTGRLPDAAVACVGGGSNAIGLFRGFLSAASVKLYGVEAAGHGVASGSHAATLTAGRVGVLHGSKSYVLCDEGGQIQEAHSISAGLDYPGVGPEHAWLKTSGRARYISATDDEALAAVSLVARTEGILPALETSHPFAKLGAIATEVAQGIGRPATIVLCLSGRGDKDLETLLARLLPPGGV